MRWTGGPKKIELRKRFVDLEPDAEHEEVNAVDEGRKMTRESGMVFNVADVGKPLVSAVKVCDAGNRIVMDPEPDKCYIEKVDTGERMKSRSEKGTFVMDVQFVNG